MEGEEHARYSACYAWRDVHACVRIMSRRARSFSRTTKRPRGRNAVWKNMNHFSGPLTHLRIRRAAPVHAAAFICPAMPRRGRLSLSVYVRNNFVNPARRTECVKRGSKNVSIDRSERESSVLEEQAETLVYHATAWFLSLHAMEIFATRKTKHFQFVFCFDILLATRLMEILKIITSF